MCNACIFRNLFFLVLAFCYTGFFSHLSLSKMFQSSNTKTFKVTAVFCQTAIDSAQNDHAMMAQSILENKD